MVSLWSMLVKSLPLKKDIDEKKLRIAFFVIICQKTVGKLNIVYCAKYSSFDHYVVCE